MKTFYSASWSRCLVIVSSIMTMLLIGACIGLFAWNPEKALSPWLSWAPLLLLGGCLPFMIRGYTLTDDAIRIRRLFWETRLPLDGLESVSYLPDAMKGSLRLCGNGGLYSFTGFFMNRTLGRYRAFVTDTGRTVVLRFRNKRVVVSPDEPEAFVKELEARTNLTSGTP